MKCPPLTLWASSAENLFLILRLLRSAERSKRFFTRGAVKANSNALRSAALPKEAALQMLFPVTTSPVKMQCRSVRRRSGIALLKITIPLNMVRAQRRPFSIILMQKARRHCCTAGFYSTDYSALVSGFASALASGFAAGAAAGAAGFTTGLGGLGSSFSGKRMMCLGHF